MGLRFKKLRLLIIARASEFDIQEKSFLTKSSVKDIEDIDTNQN
jgi:hypothetical protein